jgi:uncharacterized membrane protein YdjX (TVP38/TMEM64 family)
MVSAAHIALSVAAHGAVHASSESAEATVHTAGAWGGFILFVILVLIAFVGVTSVLAESDTKK